MARIIILGGTGYAGRHIAADAAGRGHHVVSFSTRAPLNPLPAVEYVTGDALQGVPAALLEGADVIVESLSPRGPLAGRLLPVVEDVARAATKTGARLGVVGGAGSLHVAPGGPLLLDTDEFPAEYKSEAQELTDVLRFLRSSEEALDWFFVSPAALFGAWTEGEHTGTYRIGDDVLLVDAEGNSAISGADFAQAFVDEIESPAHRRRRFTVAY